MPPAARVEPQPAISDLPPAPPYRADRDIVRVYTLDQQPSSARQDDDDAPPPPAIGGGQGHAGPAGHAGNGFASLKYSLRYGVMQSP